MESLPRSKHGLTRTLPAQPGFSKGELGFCLLLAGIAVAFLLKAASAEAHEAETQVASAVPCALITEVAGQVDVLDSSRTHLLDSSKHATVPCGGWVSVGKGSAELHHRDGFTVHVGAGTFAQFSEPNTDGKNLGDHVIVFRGEVFAQAGGGSGELRIITANARARIRRGSAIIVYSHEDEETQLIALDSQSSLENRFESSRVVIAKAGEATSLNFKQLRVVPCTPRAVALAGLRPKFDDLRVPERDRLAAIHSAQSRQERIFASALVDGDEPQRNVASSEPPKVEPAAAGEPAAKHASDSESPGAEVRERLKKSIPVHAQNYSSHVDDAQTEAVHRSWANRLLAGEAGAEHILKPPQPHAKNGHGSAGEESPGRKAAVPRKGHRLTAEDEERLKLIDELSRIHEE